MERDVQRSADHAPTPQRRPGARKAEIRRIAAELFAQHGYHATTVAALSTATGLGKGALYHHIGSKEELLFEISSQHVVEMVDFGEALLNEDIPPVEKFRRLSRRLMRTIADNLPELTVFFSEHRAMNGERGEHLHDLRRRFEHIWGAILDEGVQAGAFRPVDPIVVKGLLGLHNYAYLWFQSGGRLQPEEVSDAFCDFALCGLLTGDTELAPSDRSR